MTDKKHNFLYLIWKDPRSRRNFIIGKLTRENEYAFEYCEEYQLAQEAGWKLLEAFPNEKEVYRNKDLFVAFSSRLPDPKRRGIEKILEKYGLREYDGYELLKRSTGRLPIDTYEFIDPIFPEDETVLRDFYIAGIKHHSACGGFDCKELPNVYLNDELILILEPDNEFDQFAVKVETQQHNMLGYIPRFL